MKILYLQAEVMGYTMATIRALAERGAEVHVVHWDHKKLTPYKIPDVRGVFFYRRSELSASEMQRLADTVTPAVTVVCRWMDKGYLRVSKRLRERGQIVVTGFDDQWFGTWRQRGAALLGWCGAAFNFQQLLGHPRIEYGDVTKACHWRAVPLRSFTVPTCSNISTKGKRRRL